MVEADATAKSLLDGFATYKYRAGLLLEGATYSAGHFQIILARATSRPSNDSRGLVIDLYHDCSGASAGAAQAELAELAELLQEAAAAGVEGASVQLVDAVHAAYALPATSHSRQHLAVQLVELMAVHQTA